MLFPLYEKLNLCKGHILIKGIDIPFTNLQNFVAPTLKLQHNVFLSEGKTVVFMKLKLEFNNIEHELPSLERLSKTVQKLL